MAIWNVTAQKIELMPHPNADRMEIAKCGMFQLVVGKGNYKDGDIVIFAPERAILPDSLKGEFVNHDTGISYLTGGDKNRVKNVRLRGELSEGVTIPIKWALSQVPEWNSIEDIPLDSDLAGNLGIKKYEPPIPVNMGGIIKHIDSVNFNSRVAHHDVEQFRLFQNEFDPNETVYAVEKAHGSQANIYFSKTGEIGVSSKGLNSNDQVIERSEGNLYWQALVNSGLIDFVQSNQFLEPEQIDLSKHDVQLVGEVFPCQPGYTYGQTKPALKLFRLRIDARELSIGEIERHFGQDFLKRYWLPILYHGKFDPTILVKLSEGKEQVSGQELHIREGIVVSPEIPRISRKGFPLFLKIINPKYKSSEEDLS